MSDDTRPALTETEIAPPGPALLSTIDPQSLYERLGAIAWEWPSVIPRGFVTMVCGPPGAGKSALALRLAGCITTPHEWPDGQAAPEQGGVLWVDCEGSVQGTTERAVGWGINRGLRIVDGATDFIFDDPENIYSVAATAKDQDCRVVVVDALASTHRKDENSTEMRSLLTTLGFVAAAERLSIILIHHLRKRGVLEGPEPDLDRVRGSSAIVALCRSVVAVWQPTKASETRNVQVIKANFARAPEPFGMDWVNGELAFGEPLRVEAPNTARAEAEDWLADLLRGGARPRGEVLELAGKQGFNERTIERARKRLGLVVLKGYDDERRCQTSEWGLPG